MYTDARLLTVRLVLLGMFLAFAATAVAQDTAITLYVAPNGNDAWSGTLPEPDAAGSDGPLATIAGARDRLRQTRTDGKLPGAVQVLVRGGTYSITEPISFGPEDSGSAETPIAYEAYPGERPLVSGGRAIAGWRQEGAFWVADVPGVREGAWDFSALWVNGRRCTPARTPNATHEAGDEPEERDFFYTAGPVIENDAKSNAKFEYRPDDLKPWPSLSDAIVVVFHSWETSLHRVKSLDETNHVIEFTGPAAWPFTNWTSAQWYYVEHLFEALDQPGEWFLNRKEGRVYYIPREGEDMAQAEVVAPVAKQLVLIQGKPAEGQFVEHLAFRGIEFAYTEYMIEPQGHSDSQAAFGVPAAIQAVGARRCTIENCLVRHVGTYGVWFRTGCRDNRLAHCELTDLGAGGVRIGEGGPAASDNEATQWNVVDNSFIHDGGRIFRGAIGVWIGASSYNTISHNEICDFRYTGVSVGWSWGYAPTSANHNVIEFNHIHHMSHGQLSDMGAIYTLGVSPGTILRNNLIHDILSNPKVSGGWGIYFDEGSTDIVAENNVVYNTLTGTLHQHYGRDNRVKNNIFAFSHRGQLIRSRPEEHISFFFERNIVYFNNGQLLGSNWSNGNFRMDNNCYWDASNDELDFAGHTLDEWRVLGNDPHSIVADPLFMNAEAGDFRLKPDSPVFALGFQNIDLSLVGLYGEAEWVNKPKQIMREPFSPPKPPEPTNIADDFEDADVGSTPKDGTAIEEGAGTIRVTDETAASGKHSLKFTDAAGLKHAFNPHLVYAPNWARGKAIAGFAIRPESGAVFFHEWRDDHSPYRVGPSIWIQPDGSLTANGKTLLTVPQGQWTAVQIECGLGKQADGTYALAVTLPGQAPQRFDGLSYGPSGFKRLNWFGFVSNATNTATFYLDDVNVTSQ